MHNEADRFVIYILPKLFNINLDLHIFEGAGLNIPGKSTYVFKKIPSLDVKNNPTIKLFYKFQTFGVLYTPEICHLIEKKSFQIDRSTYVNKNLIGDLIKSYCEQCSCETETLQIDNNYVCKDCFNMNADYIRSLKSTNIQKHTSVKLLNLGANHCNTCKKETSIIGFNHLHNFSICRVCCERNINKILNNRVKQFINEDFINKECKFYFLTIN